MKKPLIGTFPFDKTARTIDFSSVSGFDQRFLLAVTNITREQFLYMVGDDTFTGQFSGTTLTLTVDTASMSNDDVLMVTYFDENYIQKISASQLPLPDGAASEITLSALSDKLTAINNLLAARSDITATIYTDDTGAFYVRRDVIDAEGAVTVSFTDATGNIVVPPTGGNLRPAATDNKTSTYVEYDATQPGTGYTTGDLLIRVIITDTSVTPPEVMTFWLNQTSGDILGTNPTVGTYVTTSKDISVAQSALPDGAATASKQDTGNASLSSVDGKLSLVATSGKQDTGNASLSSIDTKLTGVATASKQDTGNASLSSIDGKLSSTATASKQDTGNASLGSIDTKMSAVATEATLALAYAKLNSINTLLSQRNDITSSVYTDDSGAYYIRRDVVDSSGTITVSYTNSSGATVTPSGTNLRPLAGEDKVSTFVLFDANASGTGYSDGDVLSRIIVTDMSVTPPTAVAIWQNMTTGLTLSTPPTGGTYVAVAKDINVTNSVLPTGASTSANQALIISAVNGVVTALQGATGINIGNIGGSAITLGQKTMANSIPVALSSDGLSAQFGATTDTAAASDTGNFTHMSLLKRLVSKLPGLGVQTASLSSSVTFASNDAQIGSAPTGVSADTGGSGLLGFLGTIATKLRNPLTVQGPAAVSTTGSITGNSDTVTLAIPTGYGSATIVASAFGSGSLLYKVSFDGGSTYNPLSGIPISATNTSNLVTSSTNAGQIAVFHLPPGATHIGVFPSGFGGAASSVQIYLSAAAARSASTGTTATNVGTKQRTSTSISGSITTGGSSQTLSAANTARQSMFVYNTSTDDLWVNDDGTAAVIGTSILIPAGQWWSPDQNQITGNAYTIIGASTGQTWVGKEYT